MLLPVFLLSFIGYEYPFGSHKLDLLWEIGCLLVSMLGLSVRILTSGTVPAGTSGRNTKRQKADALNTTGVYSIVRHPLYLGNYLIALGVSLFPRSWFLPIIVSLAFILYTRGSSLPRRSIWKANLGINTGSGQRESRRSFRDLSLINRRSCHSAGGLL
ncbi:MAG: hypothetical protein HYS70_04535 [Nitrospinae bacterium]|nr:hypothetical protein [Nitrospinota bacterium]